jgi:hypothetical protein
VSLNKVTLTGTYLDGSGNPLFGTVTFAPSVPLTDSTDSEIVLQAPVTVAVNSAGQFTVALYGTDDADLVPGGWTWQVTENIAGLTPSTWSFFLAYADGSAQDLSTLAPVAEVTPVSAYLPESGGTVSGPIILDGSPPLKLPTGTSGYVLTSDSSGGITLQSASGGVASVFGRTGAVAAESGDYTVSEVTGAAPLASPVLTGSPTAPTATALTDNAQLATTAYTDSAVGAEASRAETAEALKLAKASNLSDLASASAARTNLGLGSAAALASSAVAQTANNLSDLASESTARTNLGLGTAATLASAAVAQTANNLSDLASESTARTNLGLGSAATQASSAFVQTTGGGLDGLVTNSSASGSVTLNLASGNVFALTLTGTVTLTFSGATSGVSCSFTLYLTENTTGGYGVTWPGSVTWLGGSAPTLNTAANAVNLLVFETVNGGTTWYGSLVTGAPTLPLTVLNGGTGLPEGGATGTLLTGQGTSSPAAWQGLFAQTAVQTSACTVAPGTLVPADTSAASLTATLTSAPFSGAMCGIKQVGATVGTYATTVTCGGTDVFNKVYGGAAATSLTLSLLDQGMLLQYSAAPAGWSFTGTSSVTSLSAVSLTLAVGDVVFFTGGSLPTGLSANTRYYVVAETSSTFQVSATYGGSAITPSGSGSGGVQICGTWMVISDDLPLGQLQTLFDAAGTAAAATAYYQRVFAV